MALPPRDALWGYAALCAALCYPIVSQLFATDALGSQFTELFIFAILALGLNVTVGYAGMLNLGISAFFGVGAYIAGIVTVSTYPFELNFFVSMALATVGAGIVGVLLAAPTLRLRGDYLAIVTLGFGEVIRYAIINLEQITAGTKGIDPLPPPVLPGPLAGLDWNSNYRPFYYLTLVILALAVVMLRRLERSSYGRAWIALREDELAATCMGVNAPRARLMAFAIGAALAGLAGCLYATKLTTTGGPSQYSFNRSIIVLCCVILGGLGSIRGALLGVTLLVGFDNILAPLVDEFLQNQFTTLSDKDYFTFKGWRLTIFGLALILVMRLRPEGLLPSLHVKEELHVAAPLVPTSKG